MGHSVAVVWMGRVLVHPKVRSTIENGDCMISGEFTREEIDELVLLLKSDHYSVPVKVKSVPIAEIAPE